MALRPRTLAMLCYLAEHPDRLVTKAELRQHVWAGTHVTDTVLRVCVQEIRAALGDAAAAPQYLETVGRQGYRFLRGGDLDVLSPLTTGPIVGRQREADFLEEWFQRAAQGARQLVFVSGEAGVGKTTVVDLWLARLAPGQALRIGRGQCVEQFGEGEPYLPLLEALGQLGRGTHGAKMLAVLRQYAPMWLAQLPGLVSETELERLQRRLQGAMRARMMRELAEALEVLAAEAPLVLEDLHWSDISSVEFLTYMAQRRGPAQLLVLGAYRPVEVVLRAHPLRGWALAMQGDVGEGIAQVGQGLAAHQRVGGPELGRPSILALLAEVYSLAQQPEAGLQALAEALRRVEATEERWWEAELYRLKGALLLHLPIPDVHQAEACFQRALDVARGQQAKALELRAAMSLSQLRQRQGKREAARTLLAPVYGWFTEGFDTPDLQEAKALLEELS